MKALSILLLTLTILSGCRQSTPTTPATTTTARTPWPAEKMALLQEHLPLIDSIIQRYAANGHIPGLAYGIVANGQLIHSRFTGVANIAEKIMIDSLSTFRIASMTKSFTTMAILILRDQGKLNLDDPAAKYIPEMRNQKLLTTDAPAITLRDLMTHRAGFPEDNPFGDRQMGNTDEQLEDLMKQGPSFSQVPGIAYEYSNLGISLLGLVIRNVSGKPYQQFIAEHIFKPLGMNNTFWEYTKVPARQLAHGYRWINNSWEEQELEHDGSWGAMGGLITTIDDFAKYMNFHLSVWPPHDGPETGTVRRSSVREMQQAWNFDALNANYTYASGRPCPTTYSYGYGLGITHDCQNRVFVSHGGGLPGYGSHWRIMPDYDLGIAIFSNRTYAGWGGITMQVLDTLLALSSLTPHPFPASAVLEKKKQELVPFLPEWKDAEKSSLFAENFFPDNPIDSLRKHSREIFEKAGKINSVTNMVPLNNLRGHFLLKGEKGEIKVFFTLSPETDPKIQAFEISGQ